jgi:hypothetical protein
MNLRMCIYRYIYACVHVRVQQIDISEWTESGFIHVCMCFSHTYMCVCVYIYIYIYTFMCGYTNTCIHTHTNKVYVIFLNADSRTH